MEIKIEKGIPYVRSGKKQNEVMKALLSMEFGDSFLYPLELKNKLNTAKQRINYKKDAVDRITFSIKTTEDPQILRIWKFKEKQ